MKVLYFLSIQAATVCSLSLQAPGLSVQGTAWQDLVVSEVVEIGDRLDESMRRSVSYNAIDQSAFKPFALEYLERGDMEEFSSNLKRFHFAVVRVDESPSLLDTLWGAAAQFYSLTQDSRLNVAGGFREDVEGHPIGFAAFDDNEFLESRIGPYGAFLPPCGTEEFPPSITSALLAGRTLLARVGRAAASAVAGSDISRWGRLLDCDSPELPATVSSTVLRLCRYSKSSDSGASDVAFGAHTDATFFTIVPVASTPGLQVSFTLCNAPQPLLIIERF